MSTITDLFEGEILSVWEDEECIFISFPWVTIHILKEEELDTLTSDLEQLLFALKARQHNNGYHKD